MDRPSLEPMSKRLLLTVLLALAGAIAHAVPAGAERLNNYLEGLASLRTDFEQTLYDEDRMLLERSSGTLYLSRPGRFRWHYREPYVQVIVSDGERLWLYDSELEQVTVKRLDRAAQNTPAMLLSGAEELEEHFEVRELEADGELAWVELIPRAENATFTRIRVGFRGDDLEAMELVDSFGQLTEVRFRDVARNPELDRDLFHFQPPPGVDVIGDEGDTPGGGAGG